MHYHRIYGLSVSSTRPLEGVTAIKKQATTDIQIDWEKSPPADLHWQSIHNTGLRNYPQINLYSAKYDQAYLQVKITLQRLQRCFSLYLGQTSGQLWLSWSDNMPLADIDAYLLGPGLGFVLRSRGVSCLHGSVVGIDGKAVVIVGEKEVGKSTTAAALVKSGWSVLADDVVAPDFSGRQIRVQPGYSRIRLWPESLRALQFEPDSLCKVTSYIDKRYLDSGILFSREPLPLAAIYVLGQRDNNYPKPCISDIPTQDKMVTLLRNSHVGYGVINASLRAREFTDFHKIAANVPIRQLHRADDLNQLQQISELLYQDVKTHT